MSNIVNREFLIQNISACEPVKYEIREWGGYVLIGRVMADKASEYRSCLDGLDDVSANIALIIAFCINEDGTPLFKKEDAEWLGKQPLSIIGSLAKKIAMLNGLTMDVQEEAEKNFERADS